MASGRNGGRKGSRVPTTALSRLRQDFMRLKRDPVPYIVAEPLPSNILEWHYAVTGPEDSPYEGGIYHGKLHFPAEFPFKPPSIYMLTPNGRFKTNSRLCLSISDYHPDTWNPAWSVATILTGLLSFMLEKSPTLGSIESTQAEKRRFAFKSHEFNLKDNTFCELFPELVIASRDILAENEALLLKKKLVRSDDGRNVSADDSDCLSSARRQLEANDDGSRFYGAFTNALVIGGFAAFAWLVQHVLHTINAGAE